MTKSLELPGASPPGPTGGLTAPPDPQLFQATASGHCVRAFGMPYYLKFDLLLGDKFLRDNNFVIDYREQVLRVHGVTVDPSKVNSVKTFPIPTRKKDVRSFLGLTDLSLQYEFYTDAYTYGLGAVLAQETDDGEAVIAYASRILKPSEAKFAVMQKEVLGIVRPLKYSYPYLYGRHLTIDTGHCPQKLLKTIDDPNNLFARWISEIQGYDFDVIHRPGKPHGIADALFRCPAPEDLLTVTTSNVLQLQRQD
eukprot:gene15471-biopygen12874